MFYYEIYLLTQIVIVLSGLFEQYAHVHKSFSKIEKYPKMSYLCTIVHRYALEFKRLIMIGKNITLTPFHVMDQNQLHIRKYCTIFKFIGEILLDDQPIQLYNHRFLHSGVLSFLNYFFDL